MNEKLQLKRLLLVDAAERLLKIQEENPAIKDQLVLGITKKHNVNGNWNLAFLKECLEVTDSVILKIDGDHKPSVVDLQSNVMSFMRKVDVRCKKTIMSAGDIVAYHYMLQGKVIDSGQFGIITKIYPDLSIDVIEGGIISSFEPELSIHQSVEIRKRKRQYGGTNLMRQLGVFSPWMDRE